MEKVEQQQESMAIQTDPLSTHTASVGSESATTISTGTDNDDNMPDFPVKFKGKIPPYLPNMHVIGT